MRPYLLLVGVMAVAGLWRPVVALEATAIPAPPGATLAHDTATGDILVGSGGAWHAIELRDGTARLGIPRAAPSDDPLPEGSLPHSTAARGTLIRRVWLAEPTDRYAHGVLGDRLEAGALRVALPDGTVLTHRLPEDEVFEDLTPRLVSVAGEEMILVVRSATKSGAAPVLYRVAHGAVAEFAAAPPIGAPNRWLNPIGAADLDGDGVAEVIVVETPHLRGVLKAYSIRENRLVETARLEGVSNHDLGSTELRLHAIGDFDGDGHDDIAVRAQDGRSMIVVAWRDGALHEIARAQHDARVTGPVFRAATGSGGRAVLAYRLADGSLVFLAH